MASLYTPIISNLFPVNGYISYSNVVQFQASLIDQDTTDVLSLGVQYSQDATFSTGVIDMQGAGIASSSNVSVNAVITSNAMTSGTWYWRARAVDQSGNASSWSPATILVIAYDVRHTETITASKTISIDLSAAKFYKNSTLSYTGDASFQTSLDSGATWQGIAEGGSISGLMDMQDLTNRTILLQVNTSTSTSFMLDVYGIDKPIPFGSLKAGSTASASPEWYHVGRSFSAYVNTIAPNVMSAYADNSGSGVPSASATVDAKPTITFAAPTVSSRTPANNSTVSSSSTSLYATVTDIYGGASSVDFQVATDLNFTSPTTYTVANVASGSQTSVTVTLSGGNNYWRVRATNAKGVVSDWRSGYGLYYSTSLTGQLAPDAVLASANLTNATVAYLSDDPDSPDGSFATATSNSSATNIRVSFPTPPNTLKTGSGLQTFKAWVEKSSTSTTSNPTATISVYENGVSKASGTATTVSVSTGQLLTFTWDASILSDITGSNVEFYISGTTVGKGSSYATVSVGAIEWDYQSTVPAQVNAPAGLTYSAYVNGTIKSIVSASVATTATPVPVIVRDGRGELSASATATAAPLFTSNSFFNDFSSYSAGSTPSDWTPIWVTSTSNWKAGDVPQAIDGKALTDASITVDGRRAITWNKVGSISGDFDMVVKWYSTDATSGNIPARLLAFVSGDETQANQNGYTMDVTFPSTIRIGATQAGAYSTLTSATNAITMTTNTWYWMRFKRTGTTLYGKVWADGSAEPGTFNISIADSKFTSGPVGIGSYDFNGDRYYDEFNIGINGATIPFPTTSALSGYGNLSASGTVAKATGQVTLGIKQGYGTLSGNAQITQAAPTVLSTNQYGYAHLNSSSTATAAPAWTRTAVDYSVFANLSANATGVVNNAVQMRQNYSTQWLIPNAVTAMTNVTPTSTATALTYLQDDPAAADANSLTPTATNAQLSVTLQFPATTQQMMGTQEVDFNFIDPSYYGMSVAIIEGGTTKATSSPIYNQGAGVVAKYQFDASILSDKTGAGMTVKLIAAYSATLSKTIASLNAVRFKASVDAGLRQIPPLLNEVPVDNTRMNIPDTSTFFPLNNAAWSTPKARAVVSSKDGSNVKLRVMYSTTSDFSSNFFTEETSTLVASGTELSLDFTGLTFTDGGVIYWKAAATDDTVRSDWSPVFNYTYKPTGSFSYDRFMQQGNPSTEIEIIDVSQYQNTVTWSSVKGAGVNYAILRVYGSDGTADTNFITNAQNAKAAGVLTGGYHFAVPKVPLDLTDATAAADKFITQLQAGYGTGNYGDLMPILDLEDDASHVATGQGILNLSVEDMLQWANTFRNHFQQVTGMRLGLYTTENFVHDVRNNFNYDWTTNGPVAGTSGNLLKDMPLWIQGFSKYERYQGYVVPQTGGWTQYQMYQYSEGDDTPNIAGITTAVDKSLAPSMDWAQNYSLVGQNNGYAHISASATASMSASPTVTRTANDYSTHGTLSASGSTVFNSSPSKVRTAYDYTTASALTASATVVPNPTETRTASDWITYGTLSGTASIIPNPTKTRTASDLVAQASVLNASGTVDGKGTVSRTANDYIVQATVSGVSTVQDNANDTRTANDYLANAHLNANASVIANPSEIRTATDWTTHSTINSSASVDGNPTKTRTAADLTVNAHLGSSTNVDGEPMKTRTALDLSSQATISAEANVIANANKARTASDWTVKSTLNASSTVFGNPNVQRTANDLTTRSTLKATAQVTDTPSNTRTAMDYQADSTLNAKATVDGQPTKVRTASDLTSQATVSAGSSVIGNGSKLRTAADYQAYTILSGTASVGSAPTKVRTAADYSTQATISGKVTVASAPQKTRTASDWSADANLNASATMDGNPTKSRTAIDWSSQASISSQSTVEGDGNINNTATIWTPKVHASASATTGGMPNSTRTAHDFQASSTLSGNARTDGISQDNRTALDMSAYANLSGTSSATGRPNDTRTAQDFVSYSHDSGASTITKAAPAITRTASDLTVKASLTAKATVDGEPTSVHTASNLQGYGILSAQATAIPNPTSVRTASDYSTHSTLSAIVTVSSQPIDTRTANDYSAHSLDTAVGTIAKASPSVSRTASDYSVKATLSSNVNVDAMPSMNNTASTWMAHGTLSAKASVVENPSVARTASDLTSKATLRVLGTVSASPTKTRTANDFSSYSHESASAKVNAAKPSLIRTAKDYTGYAKSVTAKATVSTAPSKTRTATDWSVKGTLSASASMTSDGLNDHTSRDYTAQSSIIGKASVDAKPAQTIAQIYSAYVHASSKVTIEVKPANEVVSSARTSASVTVEVVPTITRTAKDLSANSHASSNATTGGKPLSFFTASIWAVNGNPKASGLVVLSNPVVIKYDPNGFAYLQATAVVDAKPVLVRFNVTYVAIQRVQTANGFIEIPIYPLGSFGYDALRVSYGDGLIGCYELADPDDTTPIRIQTPYGLKGIKALT